MIDSNSCLDRRRRPVALRFAAAALSGIVCTQLAFALDPNRDLSQYIRDVWGPAKGLPSGTIYTISQSSDGYLWIGGEKGLVRFDGLNFRIFGHSDSPALTDGPTLELLTDAEGTLWIRTQRPGLIRYRNGVFETALVEPRQSDANVTAMCRGKNGELLVAYRNSAIRYSAGRFVPASRITTGPLVISIAETSDEEIWMGTRDVGIFSAETGRVVTPGLHDSKINALLPAGNGQMWVGTDNGVLRWNKSELTRAGVPEEMNRVQTLDILRDSESNLWFGTATGLLRLNSGGVQRLQDPSAPAVTALFEDRENNLWIGTTQGLERLRDSAFLTYSDPGNADSPVNGPLYVDPSGRTWFAPSGGGLSYIQGARITRVSQAGINSDVVYSIAGYAGDIWIGRQRGGLTRLSAGSGAAETFTTANGLAQGSIYAVYRSSDGTIWAGTVNGGVSALHDGHVSTFTTANGLASNTVSAIDQTPDGRLWFATPNGLSSFSQGKWRTFSGSDGVPPGGINTLFADGSVHFIGQNINYTLLGQLCSYRGNEPATLPDL